MKRFSGAGNTFWIELLKTEKAKLLSQAENDLSQKSKEICNANPHTDGALWLEKKQEKVWVWHFYNADGSSAEMCGNAARCAALFLETEIGNQSPVEFLTKAGSVFVSRESDGVYKVKMTPWKILEMKKTISVESKNIEGHWLDTGVPHFVVELKEGQLIDKNMCAQIRAHKDFGSAGTNVTLAKSFSGVIEAKTFERGVEDFTLACGTGAVAAAVSFLNGHSGSVKVQMPGGMLGVEIKSSEQTFLIGSAKQI